MSDDLRNRVRHPLARKIVLTVATGLSAFVASEMLDGPLDVPLAQQLVLSTLVGSITLVTQFLADFDERLQELQTQQSENLKATRRLVEQEFERISEATRFFSLIENSAIRTDALTELVNRAGGMVAAQPGLFLDLAHHEIDRVTSLLRSLSDGHEIFYDGEDREWLLGIARNARISIDATSLTTVDAGRTSFEGGIWTNDLGRRYLDLQRKATDRGVRIRRLFIFDGAPDLDLSDFGRIHVLHTAAGVEVRTLDRQTVPIGLESMIFDFIVFDKVLSYDTIPASRIDPEGKPGILTTRISFDPEPVQERLERFEALWRAATPVTIAEVTVAERDRTVSIGKTVMLDRSPTNS